MEPVIRALAIAVVARGHVLLQGAPGLGKTLLSKSLAGCAGRRVQARARHGGSDAVRHHRRARLRHGAPRVRVPSGPGVRRRAAGRRDQSRRPEDAVGAARGDGGAPGHDRSPELSRCRRISWSSRRRTRASSKAPIRCRSRSSIGSCCASTSPIRRASTSWQILAQYGNTDAHAAQHEQEAASAASGRGASAVERVHRRAGAQRLRRRYRGGIARACACESRVVDARRARVVACCANRCRHARRASSSRPTTSRQSRRW